MFELVFGTFSTIAIAIIWHAPGGNADLRHIGVITIRMVY